MFTDVATQPRDDDYTQATDIALDQQNTESLAGATEADGELLSCGDAPYGKTRWFRVKAPSVGTLTVTATSPQHDSVLGVYAADGRTRLGCNDDSGGTSSSARVSVHVSGGDYLVQVGGYGAHLLADSDSRLRPRRDVRRRTRRPEPEDADNDGSIACPPTATTTTPASTPAPRRSRTTRSTRTATVARRWTPIATASSAARWP